MLSITLIYLFAFQVINFNFIVFIAQLQLYFNTVLLYILVKIMKYVYKALTKCNTNYIINTEFMTKYL